MEGWHSHRRSFTLDTAIHVQYTCISDFLSRSPSSNELQCSHGGMTKGTGANLLLNTSRRRVGTLISVEKLWGGRQTVNDLRFERLKVGPFELSLNLIYSSGSVLRGQFASMNTSIFPLHRSFPYPL